MLTISSIRGERHLRGLCTPLDNKICESDLPLPWLKVKIACVPSAFNNECVLRRLTLTVEFLWKGSLGHSSLFIAGFVGRRPLSPGRSHCEGKLGFHFAHEEAANEICSSMMAIMGPSCLHVCILLDLPLCCEVFQLILEFRFPELHVLARHSSRNPG